MARLKEAGVTLASAFALSGLMAGETSAEGGRTQELANQCRKYYFDPRAQEQEYEACIAYTIDALGYREERVHYGGLVGYFSFANSPNQAARAAVKSTFESMYDLDARREIEEQVQSWPDGVNYVDNLVTVSDLRVDLTQNRAVIKTEETWLVINESGEELLKEESERHVSTLCRIPVKAGRWLLSRWIVVANEEAPVKCNSKTPR